MKTLYFSLACVLLFATVSCKKSIEDCEVCDGLLRKGTADSASFVKPGTDWIFKYYAYTPNGIDITYKEAIPQGLFRTTNRADSIRFYYHNEGLCRPTFFAGNNKLKMMAGMWSMTFVLKEIAIEQALNNPICYAIQGDMLYIHYKESEGSNLFIMQRK
jgi:hypothetical protein